MTHQPKRWLKSNQFVIFNAYEILDVLFPQTPGHLTRIEKRQNTPHSTEYSIPDRFIFPFNKGNVLNLGRVALILAMVTSFPQKLHSGLKQSKEYQSTLANIEFYQNPQNYKDLLSDGIITPQISSRINDLTIYWYSQSTVHPVKHDIPEGCSCVTPIDWIKAIFARCCFYPQNSSNTQHTDQHSIDQTPQTPQTPQNSTNLSISSPDTDTDTQMVHLDDIQATQIIIELLQLRHMSLNLGTVVTPYYYGEEYILSPPFSNHNLSQSTQDKLAQYQQQADRSFLTTMMGNLELDSTASTPNTNQPTPLQSDQPINSEGQEAPNMNQFKCSLPLTVLDSLPRSICSSCKSKVHLYCSDCLKWEAFQTTEEAEQFFKNHSTVTNPIFPTITPQTTPQYPTKLPPTTIHYSKYSPHYDPRTDPSYQPLTTPRSGFQRPTSISQITPEYITALQPAIGLPLPCSIEIVHHPAEVLSKSTGLHSALVSPQQARLIEFPDLPQYSEEDTVILFPTDDAFSPDEIDWTKYTHCIIVEATWSGTTAVLNHPHLKNLKKVKLQNYQTLFWRNQTFGSAFLATIEAIYYLCQEVHMAMLKQACITPSTVAILHNHFLHHQSLPTIRSHDSETTTAVNTPFDTRSIPYKHELDDLLLLFLVRLRRVLSTYHQNPTTKQSRSNQQNPSASIKHDEASQGKTRKATYQPTTWKLGLNATPPSNQSPQ